MSYSSPIVPVFSYTRCDLSLRVARAAGDGSSGMPPPSSTGTTLKCTWSTRPAASRLRNSSPPPKSAMSLPGCARSSATIRSASPLRVACRQSPRLSVLEKTTFRMPGAGGAAAPIFCIAWKVLRPMRKVSNQPISPAKSISGSITIQSYSPLGPAM